MNAKLFSLFNRIIENTAYCFLIVNVNGVLALSDNHLAPGIVAAALLLYTKQRKRKRADSWPANEMKY